MSDDTKLIKFYDTNILLHDLKGIKESEEHFIISSITIEELENIKTSNKKDEQVKFEARQVVRFLNENENKYDVIIVNNKHYEILKEKDLPETNDNLIISCAYDLVKNGKDIIFTTNDLLCNLIAKECFELKTNKIKMSKDDKIYTGYKEIILTDEELAELYTNLQDNKWNLLQNEYLIIKNVNNEVVDRLKWNGNELEIIKYNQVQHRLTDKIKPRNLKQELAFDMLQDKRSKIKILQGLHGSGKTLLMVVHALNLIEKGKYDKLVWVVQNQQVADTCDIGALPGGIEEKLLPYTSILADKVGGQFGLEMLISDRKLEIIPLAFIRGRSFSNSIVMMSESENTTKAHMKLLLSRLEETSMLMLDGDFKQTDKAIFKSNSGLKAIIECLKGRKEFALMTLNDVERSKLANLASLLD